MARRSCHLLAQLHGIQEVHIMKNIFGYKKVRYKGLEKNFAQQNLLLALANLYMLGKSDLLKKPRFAD